MVNGGPLRVPADLAYVHGKFGKRLATEPHVLCVVMGRLTCAHSACAAK